MKTHWQWRISILVLAVVAAASGCTSEPGETQGPLMSLLDELPAEATSVSETGAFYVELGSYAAIAEASGTELPDAGDEQAWFDWFVGIATDPPERDKSAKFSVLQPQHLGDNAQGRATQIEEEIGFSPRQVETYASVFSTSPPRFFSLLSGDLNVSTELGRDNDISTLGSGEDLGFTGLRHSLDVLGSPIRIAQRDGLTAVSHLTPPITVWLDDDGSTLADNLELAAAVEALDDADAPAALLLTADFTTPSLSEELFIELYEEILTVPFTTLAIGFANIEGRPGNVVVYVYPSEVEAASAVTEVDNVWRNSRHANETPNSELYDIASIEQQGRVVVVRAAITDDHSMLAITQYISWSDPLVSHT